MELSMSDHEVCKRTGRRLVDSIYCKLQTLREMKQDECPSMGNVEPELLKALVDAIIHLRKQIYAVHTSQRKPK